MGLSFWHLLIILVIVFLLFGNRLPSLGKNLPDTGDHQYDKRKSD